MDLNQFFKSVKRGQRPIWCNNNFLSSALMNNKAATEQRYTDESIDHQDLVIKQFTLMLRLTSSPKHNIKNVQRASTRERFINMTMVIIRI